MRRANTPPVGLVDAHNLFGHLGFVIMNTGGEAGGGGCKCIFCCIFFASFFTCLAFSSLVFWQTMDRCVPCGVANDAAVDVDDTPKLTDGERDSEPDLAGNMDTKYRHGLPNATRHIPNMLEGRFNPV